MFVTSCQSESAAPAANTESPIPILTESAPPTATLTLSPAATTTDLPISEREIELPPSGELIARVNVGNANLVALTIDDGYGKLPFDVIMDELKARDLQATFFLVGIASINLGEERMERLVHDGHHISYHSYAHAELDELRNWSEGDWLIDYEIWEGAMMDLLGEANYELAFRPYARAPYGLFNLAFLGMTEELKLVPVGWSNDPGDLERGIKLKAGDIFLLHVRYPDAQIMGPILDEQEFEFVTLDELFAVQNTD